LVWRSRRVGGLQLVQVQADRLGAAQAGAEQQANDGAGRAGVGVDARWCHDGIGL
jgi:hypothetical protein